MTGFDNRALQSSQYHKFMYNTCIYMYIWLFLKGPNYRGALLQRGQMTKGLFTEGPNNWGPFYWGAFLQVHQILIWLRPKNLRLGVERKPRGSNLNINNQTGWKVPELLYPKQTKSEFICNVCPNVSLSRISFEDFIQSNCD